jgi:Fe-S cluster assembly iron-binding protein IscA
MIINNDIDIFITDSAIKQIKLIEDNDYTIQGQFFRVKIGGKGCGGFTYETGFTNVDSEDIIIKKHYPSIEYQLTIIIDPFTAFYTQKFTLDYLLDPQSNEEGFIVSNAADGEHKGKFFKDKSKLPPWANS